MIVTHFVIGVPEFVMNVFWPSITHSCVASSSVARVRVAPASEPASASVNPKAPSTSPAIIGTRYVLLLRLGARVEERRRAQAHAGLERDRHRRVDARELLDREAVREVVGAAAAVLVRERQTEQPELAHGEHGVDGERVVAVPRLGVRRDLRFRELAHDAAELLCSAVRSNSTVRTVARR